MEKLEGLSMDIEKNEREKLKSVFPECFSEGKLDIDKLLAMCGEYSLNEFEKYKFEWKGKDESLKLAQQRSTGTLRPCKDESVNFDETKNIYIEGDNLEVLKLLQTAYYRKIKMIYIDPPYNTGNDFVYNDDFSDPIAKYKEVTSQATKSNPENMGRFHTAWLNMMYPRLRLAANLLRDDGVCFISIDDHEVHNLRKICDEVFGEENFVSEIVWKRKRGRDNSAKWVSKSHEYLLMYAKNKDDFNINFLELDEETKNAYKNPDNDFRGIYRMLACWARGSQGGVKYDFTDKKGQYFKERLWLFSKENLTKMDQEDRLIIRGDNIYRKLFITENKGKIPESLWENVSNAANASDEIKGLFGNIIFDTSKPIPYVKEMLKIVTNKNNNDIILDFFSGSATTAHAVMQLNAEDGGNRQFIMVQLPEVCDEKSEAFKAGYKNICEIGKERIRRAGKKILKYKADLLGLYEANNGDLHNQVAFSTWTNSDGDIRRQNVVKKTFDVGFKVFKLDTSNLKTWDGTPVKEEDMQTLLERFNGMIETVKPERSDLDMVYEVMLKLGISLDFSVKAVEIDDKKAYSVGEDTLLLICLQNGVTAENVKKMTEYAPAKIILAESGLADDTVMSNAYYILNELGVELKFV